MLLNFVTRVNDENILTPKISPIYGIEDIAVQVVMPFKFSDREKGTVRRKANHD